MDNMLEKIYSYVYIGAFAVNGIALLLFNIMPDWMTFWKVLIVFGVVTFIVFLMGRLIQERFDNTLQMYLIIYSIALVVSAIIPEYRWDATPFAALGGILVFGAAFLLDGIFEAE